MAIKKILAHQNTLPVSVYQDFESCTLNRDELCRNRSNFPAAAVELKIVGLFVSQGRIGVDDCGL